VGLTLLCKRRRWIDLTARKVALLGVLVVVAVATVSATGFASTSSPARSSARHRIGRSHWAGALQHVDRRYTRIGRRLKAHFALFRGARRVQAADTPSLPAGALTSDLVSAFQLDVSQTAFVQADSVQQLWIVPGGSGACVITQTSYTTGSLAGRRSAGEGCDTTDGILQYGLVGFRTRADGMTFVHGIVPDGNDSVSVTFADGSQQTVHVTSNVVAASFPTAAMTVSFRNANGVTVSLPYTPPTPPSVRPSP